MSQTVVVNPDVTTGVVGDVTQRQGIPRVTVLGFLRSDLNYDVARVRTRASTIKVGYLAPEVA